MISEVQRDSGAQGESDRGSACTQWNARGQLGSLPTHILNHIVSYFATDPARMTLSIQSGPWLGGLWIVCQQELLSLQLVHAASFKRLELVCRPLWP